MDDLRHRLNTEYSEKLQDLESQNRSLREEIRKKETQIIEITNEVSIIEVRDFTL